MNSRITTYHVLFAACFFLLCTAVSAQAQYSPPAAASPQEAALFAAWQRSSTLPSITAAILAAEGVTDSSTAAHYAARLAAIHNDIDRAVAAQTNDYDRAEAIFDKLHSSVLTTYSGESSLRATLDSGYYNCTSAVALLYEAAQRHRLPVLLYATPAHVFATLTLPGHVVRIEMTRSNGFDFGDDLPEVVEHLIDYSYISPTEAEELGEDEVFRVFFSETTPLSDAEFLALTYNNIGVQHWQQRQYVPTTEAFEKAIVLHPSSRKYRDAYQTSLAVVLQQYESGHDFDNIEYWLKRSARLMHSDTLFVYYLLSVAATVVEHYSGDQGGLYRSRALLDTLAHVVPHDSTVDAMLEQQQYVVNYNLAVYDFNRGDYEGALYAATLLADTGTATQYLRAKSASYLAIARAERNQAATAYALLDSLVPLFYKYDVFRNAYKKVTIDYVLQSGLIQRGNTIPADAAALMKARDLLLEIYDVDSTSIYLRTVIAAVHHELGMLELRAFHYTAAIEILRIGLSYDPDNEFIRESLRLVEQYNPSLPEQPVKEKTP